jgi:hypothetical protein
MAIGLETLAAPVITGAVAVAGGSIPDGTYYGHIVAVKGATLQPLDSPWSAEWGPVVCGGGNNSIQVTWNAVPNADRYFFLLSTVSGDYADTVRHSYANSTYYAQIGCTDGLTYTLTSLSYSAYFWDRPDGVPIIDVNGGTAGAPLDMDDIVTADVAGGWNRCSRIATTQQVETALGASVRQAYVVNCGLRFGSDTTPSPSSCYFRQ